MLWTGSRWETARQGWEPRTGKEYWHSGILSTAGPEKSCGNPPAPSGKAKYSWETDSEPVPWGKGEKNPEQGSEKNLKPCAYKRLEQTSSVTACLLHNEPTSYSCLARLSPSGTQPKRKRVWIGRIVRWGRRETLWSTLGQVEVAVTCNGGPNR